MSNPIHNVNDAERRVSRRSVLYGMAVAAAAAIPLSEAEARSVRKSAKRVTSRSKAGRLKRLPRCQHTSTLLHSGAILVAGGAYLGALAEARIFSEGEWSPAAQMNTPRSQHSATLLGDGRVLVLGGFNGSSLSSAEIYDPSSDTWTMARPLAAPRHDHAASLLPDGSVLVTGGYYHGPIAEAEIYTI